MDDEDAILEISGKRYKRRSPVNQSRIQVTTVKNRLDKAMNNSDKLKNTEKKLHFNNIIAFPNITREEFINLAKTTLGARKDYIEAKNFIFKEEINACINSNDVACLISNALIHPPYKSNYINKPEMNFIRTWISSKIHIGRPKPNDIVSLLDEQQGKAVMYYPDRNLLIRGVAGSGKSVIIYKRAVFLARRNSIKKIDMTVDSDFVEKKVLLLTANASYYAYVKSILEEELKELDNLSISLMNDLRYTNNSYDYILVDEGQDFKDLDLKTISNCINEGGHITIAADGAQNVYDQNVNFASHGIKFRSEDIYFLDKNYRNTEEIAEFSTRYLLDNEIEISDETDPQKTNYIVSAKRHLLKGKIPYINKLGSIDDEVQYIKEKVNDLIYKGSRANEICVILFSLNSDVGNYGLVKEKLKEYFKNNQLNILDDYASKKTFDPASDQILVATPQSVKGLEYKHVIVSLSIENQHKSEKEKKKIYVALTRATESLTLTYSVDETSHIKSLLKVHKSMINESTKESLISEINDLKKENEITKRLLENSKNELESSVKIIYDYKRKLSSEHNLNLSIINDKEHKISNFENHIKSLLVKNRICESDKIKSNDNYNMMINELSESKLEKDLLQKDNSGLKVICDEITILKENEIEILKRKNRNKLMLLIIFIILLIIVSLMKLKSNNIKENNQEINYDENVEKVNSYEILSEIIVSKKTNADGNASYIEDISPSLSEFMEDGYYKVGTRIRHYRELDIDFLEIKGFKKLNGIFEEFEVILSLEDDVEYSLTFCNDYVDVLVPNLESKNIEFAYNEVDFITKNENGKYEVYFYKSVKKNKQ